MELELDVEIPLTIVGSYYDGSPGGRQEPPVPGRFELDAIIIDGGPVIPWRNLHAQTRRRLEEIAAEYIEEEEL